MSGCVTLLLPPLRTIALTTPEQLAQTPVWVVGAQGPKSGCFGDWRGQDASLWLDGADVLLVARSLPALPARRLRQALPAAIEDAVAGDVAALHCTAGPALPDGRRWIGAVDRRTIEVLLEELAELDIRVEYLSTPLAALLGRGDGAGVCAWPDPTDPAALRWVGLVEGQLWAAIAGWPSRLPLPCRRCRRYLRPNKRSGISAKVCCRCACAARPARQCPAGCGRCLVLPRCC